MSKFLFAMLMAYCVVAPALFAAPVATSGGQEGNGGGGVPNLNTLVSYLNGLKFLSNFTKAQIEAAILPSASHAYYAVDTNKFDAATEARLLAEYSRAMNIPVANLALFAVTDTKASQTFLLPSFFKLSPNDQMAILFHESFWIMNPTASYATAISAEMAFEAVQAKPADGGRILDLLQADKASNALKGFVDSQNQVKVYALLGVDFVKCVDGASELAPACQNYLLVQWRHLSQKYPNSLLFKFFLSRIYTNGQSPIIYWETETGGHFPSDNQMNLMGPDITLSLNPELVTTDRPDARLEGSSLVDFYGDEIRQKFYLSVEP